MDSLSMRTTEVTLNGTRIEGWADGECLTMPQDQEIAKIRRGADGLKARFATGELGGMVTIALMPNSPSAVDVNQMYQEARIAGSGADVDGGATPDVLELAVNYQDIGVTVTCREGGFLKGPAGISGGDGDFGNLKWVMEFQEIEADTGGSRQGGGGGRGALPPGIPGP